MSFGFFPAIQGVFGKGVKLWWHKISFFLTAYIYQIKQNTKGNTYSSTHTATLWDHPVEHLSRKKAKRTSKKENSNEALAGPSARPPHRSTLSTTDAAGAPPGKRSTRSPHTRIHQELYSRNTALKYRNIHPTRPPEYATSERTSSGNHPRAPGSSSTLSPAETRGRNDDAHPTTADPHPDKPPETPERLQLRPPPSTAKRRRRRPPRKMERKNRSPSSTDTSVASRRRRRCRRRADERLEDGYPT